MNRSIGPVLVLAVVLVTDIWVYVDARRRQAMGADVVVSVGPVTVSRPEHWLLACVLLWVVALPAYLVARREN